MAILDRLHVTLRLPTSHSERRANKFDDGACSLIVTVSQWEHVQLLADVTNTLLGAGAETIAIVFEAGRDVDAIPGMERLSTKFRGFSMYRVEDSAALAPLFKVDMDHLVLVRGNDVVTSHTVPRTPLWTLERTPPLGVIRQLNTARLFAWYSSPDRAVDFVGSEPVVLEAFETFKNEFAPYATGLG